MPENDNYTRLNDEIATIDEARAYHVARLGGACACCGERTPEFLEACPGEGSPTLGTGFDTPKAFYAFVDKYAPEGVGFQVLCANCNHVKGRLGVCPHQAARAASPALAEEDVLRIYREMCEERKGVPPDGPALYRQLLAERHA